MTVLKLLARHTRTLRNRLSGFVGSDTSRHDEARYFYLGPDLSLVRLRSGLGLYVDPQDRQISARVILRGHWEVWISMAVLSLLRPGDRVVEVGSNIGYYTLIMADRVGQQGQVVGLEANPRLATLANQSLGLNDFGGHAQVMNLAAMDVSVTSSSLPRVQTQAAAIQRCSPKPPSKTRSPSASRPSAWTILKWTRWISSDWTQKDANPWSFVAPPAC